MDLVARPAGRPLFRVARVEVVGRANEEVCQGNLAALAPPDALAVSLEVLDPRPPEGLRSREPAQFYRRVCLGIASSRAAPSAPTCSTYARRFASDFGSR